MPTLSIDHHPLSVPDGTTILDAAATVGIAIPTLCHRPGLPSLAGCMICVVSDETSGSGRLVPACVTPVAEGMRISTTAPAALDLRRSMLELLLSNHAADCEAPCQLACPCHFDVPAMLEQVSRGDDSSALTTVLERLALPVTLGHICLAPCEKVCRRAVIDAPVAICAAKRYAGEKGLFAPAPAVETGRRVVIVGAGPTGLAAAFFLRRQGHFCHVIDAAPRIGDALLTNVGARLPPAALEKDLARLRAMGVSFAPGVWLTPADAAGMLAACDGLVLAAGAGSAALAEALGIPVQGGLVIADKHTHQTTNHKVFAGGAAIQACRMAALACAHGRSLAVQLGAWLNAGHLPHRPHERFRSRAGKLPREALAGLLADVEDGNRYLPPAGGMQPATLEADNLRYEASRCLRCECLKKDACQFRDLCTQSQAASAGLHGERTLPGRVHAQPDIVFEAAKCVLCGICVRTAIQLGATCGPAFHGRGFDMRIGPPIGREWSDVPRDVLLACVHACPTGCLGTCRT
ncbi:MAG: 2Fe-2S iron-sulfur cluster-binding protein [Kiritimatiellia bacterium]